MASEKNTKTSTANNSKGAVFDAVVVGAGFAGMYMVYRLREMGLNVVACEEGDGVGGTWFWNRYPGARCDVESMEYSYEFSEALQQEWNWTERFASQAEILSYANHVADRFDLRPHIRFSTRVESAHFNERSNRWQVTTSAGNKLNARFCIMATGCLSSTNMPSIPGLDDFAGNFYHTGRWPQEGVDFSNRRVGIIGTGSSAIQSIPLVAEQAKSLTVFQRTATYSIPARNEALSASEIAETKANYAQLRADNKKQPAAFGARFKRGGGSALAASPKAVQKDLEARWELGGFGFMAGFNDFLLNEDANALAAEFVRNKIRGIVSDKATAELLCPDQIIGCKRLCFDTNYYDTYNRDDVHLVSVKNKPIERVTPNGLVTNDVEYVFDDLIFATGFDAMTGSLLRMDIRGRDGERLQDKWHAGPRTYLGLNMHGFPNLFTITGPGSPSVLANMVVATQQHVNWICAALKQMQADDKTLIEAEADAEDQWVEYVNTLASHTLYPTCNSWYLGANVPGKPRVFMPHLGFPAYVERCEEIVSAGYRGFAFS